MERAILSSFMDLSTNCTRPSFLLDPIFRSSLSFISYLHLFLSSQGVSIKKSHMLYHIKCHFQYMSPYHNHELNIHPKREKWHTWTSIIMSIYHEQYNISNITSIKWDKVHNDKPQIQYLIYIYKWSCTGTMRSKIWIHVSKCLDLGPGTNCLPRG